MTLNTSLQSWQIKPTTISGGHLVTTDAVSGTQILVYDSDEDAFNWGFLTTFTINEVPSGETNGSNTKFSLQYTPVKDSERVYLNGLLQEPGIGKDYTIISGSVISFTTPPSSNDVILVSYLINNNVPTYSYGYIIGGRNGSGNLVSITDRIEFPFDSGTSVEIGHLDSARDGLNGCNSSINGFAFGGQGTSIISRFSFPFDFGDCVHVGNLTYGFKDRGAACNSSVYGYNCGGLAGGTTTYSNIERIAFPFDSGTSSHVGNLVVDRDDCHGPNATNYGYVCKGYSGPRYSIIDRFQFPFDSGTVTHVGNVTGEGNESAAVNASQYGYICGGVYTASQYLSNIERFQFPFDSGTAVHIGNLSQVYRYGAAGVNSTSYGHVCVSYPATSNIDRFHFPFDSGVAVMVGNLVSGDRRNGPAPIDTTDFVSMFI